VKRGEPSNHMHRQSTSVTLQKSTISVRCPTRKYTAHFSSMKQLWLVTLSGHVGKLVVTPNEYQLWRLHYTTGRSSPLPQFSHECKGSSQSCSSTALHRTCRKWRQPSPLATPFAGSYTMQSFFCGGSLKTAFMCHHYPRPSTNFVIG
jgi:hypothetical protein